MANDKTSIVILGSGFASLNLLKRIDLEHTLVRIFAIHMAVSHFDFSRKSNERFFHY